MFTSTFGPNQLGMSVAYLLVLFTIYVTSSTKTFTGEKFSVAAWLYILKETPCCKNN